MLPLYQVKKEHVFRSAQNQVQNHQKPIKKNTPAGAFLSLIFPTTIFIFIFIFIFLLLSFLIHFFNPAKRKHIYITFTFFCILYTPKSAFRYFPLNFIYKTLKNHLKIICTLF